VDDLCGLDGLTQATAAKTCKQAKIHFKDSKNGFYWVQCLFVWLACCGRTCTYDSETSLIAPFLTDCCHPFNGVSPFILFVLCFIILKVTGPNDEFTKANGNGPKKVMCWQEDRDGGGWTLATKHWLGSHHSFAGGGRRQTNNINSGVMCVLFLSTEFKRTECDSISTPHDHMLLSTLLQSLYFMTSHHRRANMGQYYKMDDREIRTYLGQEDPNNDDYDVSTLLLLLYTCTPCPSDSPCLLLYHRHLNLTNGSPCSSSHRHRHQHPRCHL
jgi:hypothetical protein